MLQFCSVWKKIYEVITGKTSNVSENVIEGIFKLYKQQLISNLLEYKPYSKESFKTWKEESGLKELVVDDEMCNFIHLLSKEIVSEELVSFVRAFIIKSQLGSFFNIYKCIKNIFKKIFNSSSANFMIEWYVNLS